MDAQHHYRQQTVETASPGQLVSMLYHGAVAACVRGKLHIEQRDLEQANRELQRAQDIVTELRVTLDFDQGDPIAANLDMLYGFCLERLIEANVTKTAAPIDDARETLAGLATAWDDMLALQGSAATTPMMAPLGAVG